MLNIRTVEKLALRFVLRYATPQPIYAFCDRHLLWLRGPKDDGARYRETKIMTLPKYTLADLGWRSSFEIQIDPAERQAVTPARVMEVHRNLIQIQGEDIDLLIKPVHGILDDEQTIATTGDWILLNAESNRPIKLLNRHSLFKRRAAGHDRKPQLLAANVDTVFIVSSCNQEFNLPRLERYLVIASEAGVMPVIVLTKADLVGDAGTFVDQARDLQPGLVVEAVNALSAEELECLKPWCSRGQTVALLGSSGVGKSTIAATLSGEETIRTGESRLDDGKGRHTTTGRSLHQLPSGGWFIDTPGMRELQLTDVSSGIDTVFSDITDIAARCKFNDCAHESEPGCAINAAIESGDLEQERLDRWRKLAKEQAHNTASLAQRRSKDKAFGKTVKSAVSQKHKKR